LELFLNYLIFGGVEYQWNTVLSWRVLLNVMSTDAHLLLHLNPTFPPLHYGKTSYSAYKISSFVSFSPFLFQDKG